MMLCVSGIFNLVTNVLSNDCSPETSTTIQDYCVQGYVLSLSIANKKDHPPFLKVQVILNLITTALAVVGFHIIRYRFRKINVEVDNILVTPADYTCAFEHMDPAATEEEIRQWIEGLGTEQMPIKVERIVMPYNLNPYIKLKKQEKKILDRKKLIERDNKKLHLKDSHDLKRIATISHIISQKVLKIKKGKMERSTTLFVTLETAYRNENFIYLVLKQV